MVKDMEKENYWREIIAQWQASGLSMAAFCRQEGVPDKRFFWWKRRIERRNGKVVAKGQVNFVPVRIKETGTGSVASGNGLIELITPGGCVIRVSSGFDKPTLLSLLEMMGQRKC